jgi:glyoxylase-like metal-dependent hydrolase (beta-lactamase superfamily II)
MDHDLPLRTEMTFTYGEPSPVNPGIVRLVANNPSPLTSYGTNTYLVGMTTLAVIDPGPLDEDHLGAILRAAAGRPITHILITHAHRDHVDISARLKAETGAQIAGFGRPPDRRDVSQTLPSGADFIDHVFEPDLRLADGDGIETDEWSVAAIHTPGHAPDHLCFALLGRDVLFSGDHVMAWNTSLVAPPEGSMADYTASLEVLLGRPETLYLPGHGGRLVDPQRTVRAYLLHRRWREEQVMAAIRSGTQTVESIVPVVYPSIGEKLSTAAALSVLAHVEHLISRGHVTCDGSPWTCPFFPS